MGDCAESLAGQSAPVEEVEAQKGRAGSRDDEQLLWQDRDGADIDRVFSEKGRYRSWVATPMISARSIIRKPTASVLMTQTSLPARKNGKTENRSATKPNANKLTVTIGRTISGGSRIEL